MNSVCMQASWISIHIAVVPLVCVNLLLQCMHTAMFMQLLWQPLLLWNHIIIFFVHRSEHCNTLFVRSN